MRAQSGTAASWILAPARRRGRISVSALAEPTAGEVRAGHARPALPPAALHRRQERGKKSLLQIRTKPSSWRARQFPTPWRRQIVHSPGSRTELNRGADGEDPPRRPHGAGGDEMPISPASAPTTLVFRRSPPETPHSRKPRADAATMCRSMAIASLPPGSRARLRAKGPCAPNRQVVARCRSPPAANVAARENQGRTT